MTHQTMKFPFRISAEVQTFLDQQGYDELRDLIAREYRLALRRRVALAVDAAMADAERDW